MLYAFFVAVTGLTLGSFMNVLVHRVPRGLNIALPPSFCPMCSRRIRWYSNIPVLSYILQRGKCAECQGKIPFRYPIIELTTAFVFVLIFFKIGVNVVAIKYCFFAFLLLAAAFTDLYTSLDNVDEGGVIPDIYTVFGVGAGYLWAFVYPATVNFHDSLAGSGAGVFVLLIPAAIYHVVRQKEGIGLGDVFMMGMVGSFLGPAAVLPVLAVSSVIGAAVGIMVVFGTKNRDYRLPFAPMIAAGAIGYVLVVLGTK